MHFTIHSSHIPLGVSGTAIAKGAWPEWLYRETQRLVRMAHDDDDDHVCVRVLGMDCVRDGRVL